jgi:hypothetical protein
MEWIQDPCSGQNLSPIPDSEVKRAPDPGYDTNFFKKIRRRYRVVQAAVPDDVILPEMWQF